MNNISKKEQVKVGSIWTTAERLEFKVNDVKNVEDQIWIHYSKLSTAQEYSCLQEAFVSRFQEKVNNG
jgi:hypothetical protein